MRRRWQPQRHRLLYDRINKIGSALLSLKEVEYLGEPRSGNPIDRAERLVCEVLKKLEADWKFNDTSGSVVARVKRLRTSILNGMVGGQLSSEERERRWRDLAMCYYVQQISHYPRDYLSRTSNLPERVIETVERFVEDFTDQSPKFEPFHAVIDVGEAIPVGVHRDRSAGGDPIMVEVKRQLDAMIAALAAERTPA